MVKWPNLKVKHPLIPWALPPISEPTDFGKDKPTSNPFI